MTVSVLVPTAVFVGSWLVNGPYEGFRDDRIFNGVVDLRVRIHAGLDECHLPVYRSCVRKEVNQIPAGWGSPLSRMGRSVPR